MCCVTCVFSAYVLYACDVYVCILCVALKVLFALCVHDVEVMCTHTHMSPCRTCTSRFYNPKIQDQAGRGCRW